MKIIKEGRDLSKERTCGKCGCVFLYIPGDIIVEHEDVYNVPLKCQRRNGGACDPVRVDAVQYVRCPCCGCYREVSRHENY